MPADPFDLQRFLTAQDPVWDEVCAELRAGRKRSHWMWFIFPQLATLGRSAMARHYGLSGLDEAKAYLAHPLLGERLRACCHLLMQVQGATAVGIFGETDAMKLRSCLTLFMAAGPQEPLWGECLQRYFGGAEDPLTIAQLQAGGGGR